MIYNIPHTRRNYLKFMSKKSANNSNITVDDIKNIANKFINKNKDII